MDGVLVDSKSVMEDAWSSATSHFGLDIPFSSYLEHVGKPFESILTQLHIPDCLHANIKSFYGNIASQKQMQVVKYKHIDHLLRKLHYNDFKIAIVTSKEFWRADSLVDSLFLTNNLLVTPEFTLNGKPSPEPLLFAMNKLNLSPKNSFYVGDMESDMLAANAAGVTFLAASWGYGQFDSRTSLDSPMDLLEFLSFR